MNFKTIMIYVDDSPLSKAYASHCSASWEGFDLTFYSAVTPKTLDSHTALRFGRRANGAVLTPTEKACFYSQYNLWVKCAKENIPILILEHDAFCVKPTNIEYNPHLNCQFYGQHSMEAVMYHPNFCRVLINYCTKNNVSGPMSLVDNILGYFNRGEQSRYAKPHARWMGPDAPVKSVIDPKLGSLVQHGSGTTADRLKKDGDLFKQIDVSVLYNEFVESAKQNSQ